MSDDHGGKKREAQSDGAGLEQVLRRVTGPAVLGASVVVAMVVLTWWFKCEAPRIEREARREELILKATHLLNTGKLNDARAALDELSSLFPEAKEMDGLRAEIQRKIAEVERRVAEAERRRKIGELLAGARVARSSRQLKEARNALLQVLELDPGNARAKADLAEVVELIAIRQREAERRAEFQGMMAKGEELFAAGKLFEAAEVFEAAAEYDLPGSAKVRARAARTRSQHHAKLATAAFEKGDMETATKEVKEAWRLSSDMAFDDVLNAVFQFSVAEKAFEDGRIAEAEAACKRSLELRQSEHTQALAQRITLVKKAAAMLDSATRACRSGDWATARQRLDQALKTGSEHLNRDLVRNLRNAIVFHEELSSAERDLNAGRPFDALVRLEKARVLDPLNKKARLLLNKARRMADKGGGNPYSRLLLAGRSLLAEGKYPEAAAHFSAATRVRPGEKKARGELQKPCCFVRRTVYKKHEAPVLSAAFSPRATKVATSSTDGKVHVWNAAVGKTLLVLEGHLARVTSVAFSSAGSRIATASADGTVRVWSAADGKQIACIQCSGAAVLSVAFTKDAAEIVAASADGTLGTWAALDGELLSKHDVSVQVDSAVFSANCSLAGLIMPDGEVCIHSVAQGKKLLTLSRDIGEINCIALSPDGSRMAAAAQDNTIRMLNTNSGSMYRILRGCKDRILSIVFSPDGSILVACPQDGTAVVWHAKSGKKFFVFEGHKGPVHCVAFSSDGRRAVTASEDGTACAWILLKLRETIAEGM